MRCLEFLEPGPGCLEAWRTGKSTPAVGEVGVGVHPAPYVAVLAPLPHRLAHRPRLRRQRLGAASYLALYSGFIIHLAPAVPNLVLKPKTRRPVRDRPPPWTPCLSRRRLSRLWSVCSTRRNTLSLSMPSSFTARAYHLKRILRLPHVADHRRLTLQDLVLVLDWGKNQKGAGKLLGKLRDGGLISVYAPL